MSQERVSLIKSLGAKIVPVRRDQGGFLGSIRMTEELAEHQPHVFLPAQFANEANVEAHEKTTGPEIWWQLYFHSIAPDAFVAGVGTGGTIMGVGKFLRERNPQIKIHPLQPLESPTLSTGHKVGHHRIQGISDEFIPSILQLDQLCEVGDRLRLTRLAKLEGRVQEASRDCKGGESLERDLNDLDRLHASKLRSSRNFGKRFELLRIDSCQSKKWEVVGGEWRH